MCFYLPDDTKKRLLLVFSSFCEENKNSRNFLEKQVFLVVLAVGPLSVPVNKWSLLLFKYSSVKVNLFEAWCFPHTAKKKTCRRNSFQRIKINNSDKLLVTETPWTFRCGQCANFPLGRSHSLPIFVSLNLSGNELSVRKEQGTLHWCAEGSLLGITIPLHLILFILFFGFFLPHLKGFFHSNDLLVPTLHLLLPHKSHLAASWGEVQENTISCEIIRSPSMNLSERLQRVLLQTELLGMI